jgi:hypothetical protein
VGTNVSQFERHSNNRRRLYKNRLDGEFSNELHAGGHGPNERDRYRRFSRISLVVRDLVVVAVEQFFVVLVRCRSVMMLGATRLSKVVNVQQRRAAGKSSEEADEQNSRGAPHATSLCDDDRAIQPSRILRVRQRSRIGLMADRKRLHAEVLQDLQNLIAAIDRRLPRLLHVDEAGIARDAAELRAKALEMIAKIQAAGPSNLIE